NFFANPEWRQAFLDIKGTGQPVKFNGIDARILTEEQGYKLDKIKHEKQICMAWDNPKDDLRKKFTKIAKWIRPYKIMVYILIGYWSDEAEDLYRVKIINELGMDPFVMPFSKNNEYQRHFARWVNHKATFNSTKWEDYTG
ncbi:unnamed protein product, partial [marine sediment metagenome]